MYTRLVDILDTKKRLNKVEKLHKDYSSKTKRTKSLYRESNKMQSKQLNNEN